MSDDDEGPTERRPPWQYALGAVGLTVLGVVGTILGSIPGVLVGQNSLVGFLLALVGSELGYAAAGVLFLVASGRGLAYLDLSLPGSARAWGLVVGVTLGALVFRVVVLLVAFAAGVEPAASSVTQVDIPTRTLLLVLIPGFLLIVGPAEELLFRGVIQKYLREAFSPGAAIIGAGLLFGLIHVLALSAASPVGSLVSLTIITIVGLALGWLYERTGSLPAAMLAHGAYNALIAVTALAFQAVG